MIKKVLISSCLLGVNCRYDGKNSLNEELISKIEGLELISVCPEELGGLPTPRPPAEIQKDGSVKTTLGKDVTSEYRRGAQQVLDIALQNGITEAYLKSKSPMCGKNRVYDGTFAGVLIDGNGVLVELLEKNGIKVTLID